MRKRHKKKARVELGDAVILKVDERDRANHNPLGIQGIVAAKAGTGSNVKVVCLAGVLSSRIKPMTYAPEELGVLKNPRIRPSLKNYVTSKRVSDRK